MGLYLFLFSSITFFGIFTDFELIHRSGKTILNSKGFLWFFGIILFIVSAIRYGIGVDYQLYSRIFAGGLEIATGQGWLYAKISELLRFFGAHFNILIALNSFAFLFGTLFFIKKYSDYKYISVIMILGSYFYFTSFNVFRQYSSVSLILIGLVLFYYHNKKVYGILFLIFGIGLHSSSLAFIPLFFFGFVKIKARLAYKILIFAFLLFFITPNSLRYEVFEVVLSMNDFFAERYAGSDFAATRDASLGYFIFQFVYFVPFLKVLYEKAKKEENIDWIEITFLLYFLNLAFLPISELADRLNILPEFMGLVIAPRALKAIKSPLWKTIFKVVLIVLLFIRMFSSLISNHGGVVPYETIFSTF